MPGFKVTVVGSCGHIGQSLSMLLKLNPHVSELSVCDLESAKYSSLLANVSLKNSQSVRFGAFR
jgi:malate/lactate dehydrogenase